MYGSQLKIRRKSENNICNEYTMNIHVCLFIYKIFVSIYTKRISENNSVN